MLWPKIVTLQLSKLPPRCRCCCRIAITESWVNEFLDPTVPSSKKSFRIFGPITTTYSIEQRDRIGIFSSMSRGVVTVHGLVCSLESGPLSFRLKSNTNARGLDCFFFLGKRAEKGNRRKRIEGGQKWIVHRLPHKVAQFPAAIAIARGSEKRHFESQVKTARTLKRYRVVPRFSDSQPLSFPLLNLYKWNAYIPIPLVFLSATRRWISLKLCRPKDDLEERFFQFETRLRRIVPPFGHVPSSGYSSLEAVAAFLISRNNTKPSFQPRFIPRY